MKKKKKILSCVLALFVAVMTVLPGFNASAYGTTSNVTGYAPGGWKIHHTDGHIQTNPPGMIYMDADTGEWLFCVEPHTNKVGGAHNSRTDLASYLGDASLAKRLSLIAYYSTHSGWGNDGWAVGQSMIWQLLTQRAGESGEQYVITPNIPDRTTLQNYYNAVNAKVDAYLSYPSFDGSTVTVEAGKSITVTDTKGVLSSMRVRANSNTIDVSQNGNQVTITAKGTGASSGTIRFYKPLENGIEGQNFVYTDSELQDLMTCNYYDPLYATLNINVTPATTSMTFSKQDLTTGAELPGAKLQVTDESGSVIDRWTSTDQPHQIEGLIVGRTYYMEETLPADGYVTANRITFVADRNAAPVVMKDDVTKFEISKKDLTDGAELPGAHLQVTDEAGTVIDEWVSTDTPHYMEKLVVGKTYTLHEKEAPKGYLTADDVKFTVADTGEIQTVAIEDELAVIKLEVGKETIRRTQAGDTYKYTITNIKNASNTALENFTCTDSLPDLVIMKELHTGTFNFDLTYAVSYQINGSGEWHTLAEGLSTTEDHVLSFTGIPLQNGEQVTGFRYEFGTVPEGFGIGSVEPVYFVNVKNNAKASEKLVNHIKLTGDWRGSTTEANDETVTLLFENSITAVLTGDALPGVYLFISMMVSALVLCAVIISRKRSRE